MTKKRNKVDPVRFIQVWQTSRSIKEALERLQITEKTLYVWKVKMSKNGVPLKRMKRQGQSYDWKKLAALARSLNGKAKA